MRKLCSKREGLASGEETVSRKRTLAVPLSPTTTHTSKNERKEGR
jgi:hypothetical protein